MPPFQPIIPVSLLPYLAFVLLTLTFGLAFYFSTSVLLINLCPRISRSLQLAERDNQGVDGSSPRERTWRFRNGSHVLYRRSIRVTKKASHLFQNTRAYESLNSFGVISIASPSEMTSCDPTLFNLTSRARKRVLPYVRVNRTTSRLIVHSPSVFALDTLR